MVRKLHFPYHEVNTRILMFFLRSTSCIVIFLAYSVFFFFIFFFLEEGGGVQSENDIFLKSQPFSKSMST